MSTRRHFGIVLLLCSMSLGYNYRLVENPVNFKTCPARNKEIPFEEPRLNSQPRTFYNVHDIPSRHLINSNENEVKSENWFLRIFNIKTLSREIPGNDENQHADGFAKLLLDFFKPSPMMVDPLQQHKNQPKILFILKKNPLPEEHHIVKRDPIPYNFM
ncbi:uncharacterized protein LOC108031052 [Drosophila biarmipes]|uniref:uncharacterized protein LOC108031052 n=1 Tax=Drosophila biarmipes TaxID=125945 RepID=UPI0007E6306F|nr:uncharacterized protein LOC108031052 [Drosophila biarmipes]